MEKILLFNDFELKTYQYKEHIDYDGLLEISIRVLLSESRFKELKDKLQRGPYNLIRPGIDDKPRRVAYSLGGWSKDGDNIKCQITFIEFKENRQLRTLDPLWNLIPLVSKQVQMIEQLSKLLIQRKIITEDEYKHIESQVAYTNFETFYVSNLDEYEF